MNPKVIALLIIIGMAVCTAALVVTVVLFREWFNLVIFLLSAAACIVIVVYHLYLELVPVIQAEVLENQEIEHRFHGDPQKMKFYRGFKKYFDGSLSSQGLEQWFKHHTTR